LVLPKLRLGAIGTQAWARELDCADVTRDLLRTVLGLERYRQQHGRYPADLGRLRASGWKVPVDRFSEADFVYRPQGTRFLLYSVGPNLEDDGGEPGGWPFYRRRLDPDEGLGGDIVWRR
jgi:hypothetical protein